MFSAGFRPFFLMAGLWSAIAVPVWLYAYAGHGAPPSALAPVIWHVHEMVFGFALASVAGFLLTAIPNWTGRLPLRGGPLAALALLWLAGRVAVLCSARIGPAAAALVDLAFPATLIFFVARELIAGRNWRNLPMVGALSILFTGSLLVHLHALDLAYTAPIGNRLGLATLLMLIALVGGRITPSFTRNWLARHRPNRGPRGAMPVQGTLLDAIALGATFAALAAWAASPQAGATPYLAMASGLLLGLRLRRWCGLATLGEPLLFVLHAGYAWLAFGMLLLGANALYPVLPPSAAIHALTMGAIGTMTLAVMTRATRGHSGLPLTADRSTTVIYLMVTLATLLRLSVPLAWAHATALTLLAGLCWTGAFLLFVLHYAGALTGTRIPLEEGQYAIRLNS